MSRGTNWLSVIISWMTRDRMSIIVLQYARCRMRIVLSRCDVTWSYLMFQGRVTLFVCVAVTWLFTRNTPIYKTYTCQKNIFYSYLYTGSSSVTDTGLPSASDKLFTWGLSFVPHWCRGFSSSQILYCTVANVTYPNISKEHSITCNRVSRSHTEDGGNTFLWNVSKYLPPVMTLLPRSLESPVIALLTCYHLTCGNCLFRIFYLLTYSMEQSPSWEANQ